MQMTEMNGKMTEVKATGKGDRMLRDVIRRELGSETNRRFLKRMPAFRAECSLPDRIGALLGELDKAEQDQGPR